VDVVAGAIAGSILLVGFGIDSFIEVTSGSVLLWRMSVDGEVHRRELNERRALKILGVCFLLLAAYIAYETALDLWSVLPNTAFRESFWSGSQLSCPISTIRRLRPGGTCLTNP
jgi:hypothetical protein